MFNFNVFTSVSDEKLESKMNDDTQNLEPADSSTGSVPVSEPTGIGLFWKRLDKRVALGVLLCTLYIICGFIFSSTVGLSSQDIDINTQSLKIFALYIGVALLDLCLPLGILGIVFNLVSLKFKTKLCSVYNTVVCCLSVILLLSAYIINR